MGLVRIDVFFFSIFNVIVSDRCVDIILSHSEGIRNFLTLFLSIEVSKAMRAVSDAKATGDMEAEKYHQAVVDCFTSQLNESDPILTAISNAMTEEGYCKEKINELRLLQNANEIELQKWQQKEAEAAHRKMSGNVALMDCSARYNERMKAIRQSRANSCCE